MTIALLFSLGMCIVQKQSVWVNFACTKRFFILSAETIINARNAPLCVRCGIFLLKIKQIPFSCRLVKGFTILKRIQNQFKLSLEMCIVPVSIVSIVEMQIYWWLCNNSEIQLWLWKLWSLVVCSQSSFHATRARKDVKNRRNTLFLC